MINESTRKQIKKILGNSYSVDIALILKEKGFTKKDGTDYTSDYVRQVFNGRFFNEVVLKVIINQYKVKKRRFDKLSENIDNLNKKSPSGNLG